MKQSVKKIIDEIDDLRRFRTSDSSAETLTLTYSAMSV